MHQIPVKVKRPQKSVSNTWLQELNDTMIAELDDPETFYKTVEMHINKCIIAEQHFLTNSMLFLLDNSRLQYLYLSRSVSTVLGYSKEELWENGFEWIFTIFPPSELEFKKQLMSDIFGFLKTLPEKTIKACTVRYDTVIQKKNGHKIHVLEELMFPELTGNNDPSIITCFVHDLVNYGHTNSRNCMIFTFESGEQQILFNRSYIVEQEIPLTTRELEMLEKFSNGLSTAEVAKALHVSQNTVKTHRKNILLKLRVSNTAEGIKMAIQNKWIG